MHTNREFRNITFNDDRNNTKSNAIEIPSISLPKGGGAIKGIDEKFSVNAVNGASSFSIPLPFSPARGVSPALGISYNSGSGNGIFGLGWNLSLGSISRKTDKGLPQYLDAIDSDTFLFSEAEDLVPEFRKNPDGSFQLDSDGEYIINERDSADELFIIRNYKPRVEGLFARIERWSEKTTGIIKWRIITRDNTTTLFGWTSNSVVSNPNDSSKIYKWLPEFVFDDKGNCSQYIYRKEDDLGFDNLLLHNRNRIKGGNITYTNLYLEKVIYGNKTPFKKFGDAFLPETDYMFQTIFDYGTTDLISEPIDKMNEWGFRLDAFSDYKSGFEIRTTRLCKRVLLFHVFEELALKPDKSDKKTLIRSVNFEYDTSIEQDFTFLKNITSYGFIKKPDGSYSNKKLPAMEFEYQKHEWSNEIKSVSPEALVHAPNGIEQSPYQFVDLYNEGLSGILSEQSNGWYYKHNLGIWNDENDPKLMFENAKLVSPKPSFTGMGSVLQLSDLDADGGKQLVSFEAETRGYFELDDENVWQGMQLFKGLPNIDFGNANTRMLDLNGDGKPEVVISEDHVFTWYTSEGKNGFSAAKKTVKPIDEEEGPHIVFADEKQSIYLADMSGDGMSDIVRIRNSEICYWPNLGYGNFGTKVAFDNAPIFDHPDAFNPAYLRLVDIDGSGTSDIIYLGKNKFFCWKNLSGNRFGIIPFEIDPFPEIHSQSKVNVTDLLGNGVACLVWSSPLAKDTNSPLKYIDLMNSKKPHIMVSYKNNLGKEVYLEYTPSTKFYIKDKLAGKPWITKLHFPVHCISKTITLDKISGYKFVSEYKYHHGYFDHAEREFRGFGMVEQIDAETFEHWIKQDASNITERELHQEPVVSKSWHHTGAFLKEKKILDQFEQEYWQKEMTKQGFSFTHYENPLPEAKIVDSQGNTLTNLSIDEWREALRACKGMGLRSEVFALDAIRTGDKKKELTPFTVDTHNCIIEMLQPKGKNKHAVFIVKESEAITYNYERNTEDPRIAHSLNTKLDEYGNVLESASIVYLRMKIDPSLPSETIDAQRKTVIIYSENNFTNDIITDNNYRLRLACETKTYELSKISKSEKFYNLSDFKNILSATVEVPYQQLNESTIPTKRLIEHIRSNFYSNDIRTPLPLGRLESLALPYENYQLAYTPDLLIDIFNTRVDDALMIEGKYSHSIDENGRYDPNWWVRSGTTQLLTSNESINDALNRFYLPISYIDPYQSITTVEYDIYHLAIINTEDAISNKASVQLNYRTLSAKRLTDANNNISEAITDELGLVKALAVMGKGNQADDLTGLNESTDAVELSNTNAFFNAVDTDVLKVNANNLLKHATARFVYDFDVYKNTGKPTVVVSILREEHFVKNNNSPIQISFEYSNGLGKVAMKKVQAEPGLAKKVTINANNNTYTLSNVDTGSQLRWLGNGRTILNNKGNAVKQYEPYFSASWHYEDFKELVETGVTPIMYYDAAGRLIKTEMPNGSFSKVEFDSWKQAIYDANDTIKDSNWHKRRTDNARADFISDKKEQDAAAKAVLHNNTPSVLHLCTLGKPVASFEYYEDISNNTDKYYATKVNIDTEGNLRKVIDARENTVMEYKYDILGNMVYQKSMDAGQRWLLHNILGNPLRTWDERNHEFIYAYDKLHRPIESWVKGGDGNSPLNHLFDKIIYGEKVSSAETKNLRGQVYQHYDTGGLLEMPTYDFSGKPEIISRRLYKKYKEVANWNTTSPNNVLEDDEFIFKTETDALGRITKQIAPDGSIITPYYNEASVLTKESVLHINENDAKLYLEDIEYNEKGQRSKIRYGNNVLTNLYYDNETFKLTQLKTTRLTDSKVLQNLLYTYDPVGNITCIEDNAIPTQFFGGRIIEPKSEYIYDALYRLIKATGRENTATLHFDKSDNWNDAPFMQPIDANAIWNYEQRYSYDSVGNIIGMMHKNDGSSALAWSREFTYENLNNRLESTSVGNQTYRYPHHPQHGYMTAMPHLEEMDWNFKEELVKTIRQKRIDDGTPETTYYQYDGNGQRIRKITENQVSAGNTPTKKDERIYIAGYELYKKPSTAGELKRVSLSLMDGDHRFVIVETRNDVDDGTEKKLVRYQLNNHLGSANIELNETAQLISYEEYHPYGTTAYQAKNAAIKAAAKRYRYTGMERDEETGLEYHSARYYLPWLGRWCSADPIGIGDGVNVYGYCGGNPAILYDWSGKQSDGPPLSFKDVFIKFIQGTGTQSVPTNPDVAKIKAAWELFTGKKLVWSHDEPKVLIKGGDIATARLEDKKLNSERSKIEREISRAIKKGEASNAKYPDDPGFSRTRGEDLGKRTMPNGEPAPKSTRLLEIQGPMPPSPNTTNALEAKTAQVEHDGFSDGLEHSGEHAAEKGLEQTAEKGLEQTSERALEHAGASLVAKSPLKKVVSKLIGPFGIVLTIYFVIEDIKNKDWVNAALDAVGPIPVVGVAAGIIQLIIAPIPTPPPPSKSEIEDTKKKIDKGVWDIPQGVGTVQPSGWHLGSS